MSCESFDCCRNIPNNERLDDDDFHYCFRIVLGVTGLQVEELWSLDAAEFKNLG